MFQNEKHVGQIFQGIAGVLTALTVLATVIFTLLGVFGVVDMGGVRERGFSLAYVVAVGAFALSPVVAVGIVAVGLFNAIGIIAIGAGSARGIIAISGDDAGRHHCHQRRRTGVRPPARHRRGSEGHVHRVLLGPQGDGIRAMADVAGQGRLRRLIPHAPPGASCRRRWRRSRGLSYSRRHCRPARPSSGADPRTPGRRS